MMVVGIKSGAGRQPSPTDRFHTGHNVATGIVTANAEGPFVTGARDGHSDLTIWGQD